VSEGHRNCLGKVSSRVHILLCRGLLKMFLCACTFSNLTDGVPILTDTSDARLLLVHDTKTVNNVPNEHKMSQMVIKILNVRKIFQWPYNISTFSNLRLSKIYQNWDIWFENKPYGNNESDTYIYIRRHISTNKQPWKVRPRVWCTLYLPFSTLGKYNLSGWEQSCQMVGFQTQNPNLGKFWRGP
jgi:hypothetical protein